MCVYETYQNLSKFSSGIQLEILVTWQSSCYNPNWVTYIQEKCFSENFKAKKKGSFKINNSYASPPHFLSFMSNKKGTFINVSQTFDLAKNKNQFNLDFLLLSKYCVKRINFHLKSIKLPTAFNKQQIITTRARQWKPKEKRKENLLFDV